jgi:hypothetical protein
MLTPVRRSQQEDAMAEDREASIRATAATDHPHRVTATLYDGAGGDRSLDIAELGVTDLPDSSLVWIDVDLAGDRGPVEDALERAGLPPGAIMRFMRPAGRARDSSVGRDLRVETITLRTNAGEEGASVICIVGESLVVTVHDGPIALIDHLRRTEGGRDLGFGHAPSILAALLARQIEEPRTRLVGDVGRHGVLT